MCNATGTEKLKPLFIHKYQNPRALNEEKKEELPVNYYWNSTAQMQAQYRKLLIRNRIEAYEISQELNKEPTPINIHDSIDFSVNAWNSVSQQTINNCWKHTGILPINEMDEIDEIEDQALHDEMELQDLINELPFDNFMDADEFLHIE
ncbi:hypothetical protein RirG_184710 [Rhizophagus irregularis DAOM 197198w]|uniref:DDE-1 domain-containing protein n=1 Tax=Rhizophagus irregularis (strain DAOM 197198w) TaxID=1432141 RepID=A0A015IZP9_RHIIW|nr:hypothetical protein RirG_184710 [Rhizophagus irregularis DAOM 197198w]